MKNYTLFITAAICLIAGASSLQAQTTRNVCGNDPAWQQAISLDPSLVLRRQQTELAIQQFLKDQALNRTSADDDSVRIIPTVVHVMQEGGTENIADTQIYNAIWIFNKDYRRQNFDTVNTPAAFKPVAADSKIEFRLATIDPNGNCTNGIDRVFTHRTDYFNDYSKSIIDWPSDKYFNIWICKSIGVFIEGGGYVIGYAQFPVSGLSGTDGIVLEHDFVGSGIGTAQSFYAGRDGTHEAGHYFDLHHTWGDAVCGDDFCEDTPTQDSADYGCPAYPHITCGNNGDMSDNYMDYADGDCKDIFTLDQKLRMRAALEVARYTLWQPSNLAATGTDGVTRSACAPVAEFLAGYSTSGIASIHLSTCAGSTIHFKDNSTNGAPTAWNWSFPGGTPSSSPAQNPSVTYATPGTYDVSLTVTNSFGTSTKSRGGVVVVDNSFGYLSPPFTEGFDEGSQSLPSGWQAYNDDGGPGWQITNRASYSGNNSVSVQNYETLANTAPGSVKELVSPSFNFGHVTSQPTLSFRVAYGQQYTGNKDSLSVDISGNCGVTWTELKHFTSNALSIISAGLQSNDFAPGNPSQWGLVSLAIPAIYESNPKVKFRFYFKTDVLSTNIYLDDINVNGVVGIEEQENPEFSFNADPNPASQFFTIGYLLKHESNVAINIYDLEGRLIRQIEDKQESPGVHEFQVDAASFNLSSGVYILRMVTPDGAISKKLVYSGN